MLELYKYNSSRSPVDSILKLSSGLKSDLYLASKRIVIVTVI